MPTKRKKTTTTRRPRKGKGLGDILSGVNNFLKKTKLISTIGSMVPNGAVQGVSGVAGALGYGRKRKPRAKKAAKPKKGKGFLDSILGPIMGLIGGKRGKATGMSLRGVAPASVRASVMPRYLY